MPVSIPFLPSDSNYTLVCPLDDRQVHFDVRWNSRDEAFYFDMYDSDDTVICLNIKVVPGIPLGRRSKHEFFNIYLMVAIDPSGKGQNPTFDELNTRVLVTLSRYDELVSPDV